MADWLAEPYHMICASSEAESKKYHMYVGKSGRRWLVADVRNAGEYIYVEGGPNSRGFAGRTLRFELVDGGFVELQGPWCTEPEGLFKDTGIDVRDKFLTFCVIAKRRRYIDKGTRLVMVDILYKDDEPQLGPYGRPEIKALAKKFATELGHSVQYHYSTLGGGSTGPVDPEGMGYVEPPGE